MYKGVYVALITPFKDDLSVDYDTLKKLVQFHIKNKTNGLVVCGTTAETATLSDEEYKSIINFVEKVAQDKIDIVIGVGSNSTSKTLKNIEFANTTSAKAVLLVTPYYNKPSQRGLKEHFSICAKASKKDVILYDIPGRTGVKIDNDLIKELSDIPNIKAIKDATGNLLNISYHKQNTNLDVLSGDDTIYYEQLLLGADGTISVTANVYPDDLIKITKNPKENLELAKKMEKISKNLFIEGNPVTIKAYMYLKGMCPNYEVRLPLVKASDKTLEILKSLL